MKKKSALLWVGIVVLLLLVGAGVYYFFGVSADTLNATKGTKVQLVDSDGVSVKQAIPLELTINGRVKQCNNYKKTTRIGFWKKIQYLTRCQESPFSKVKVEKTDVNGSYNAGTLSYRNLTQKEYEELLTTFFQDATGRELTPEEKKAIITSEIAKMSNGKSAAEINSAAEILANKLLVANNSTSKSKSSSGINLKAFLPLPISILSSIFGSKTVLSGTENNYIIDSISVEVLSTRLKSDQVSLTYGEKYKANANLLVYPSALTYLNSSKDLFVKYLASLDVTTEKKTEYQTVLDNYLDYLSTVAVHDPELSKDDENKIKADNSINDILQKIAGDAGKNISKDQAGSALIESKKASGR